MKNRTILKTIYQPNYILKSGSKVWLDMLNELVTFRGLIWRLIVRDISAKYKQSLLGVFWAFLTPMVMMIIFVWLKNQQFLPIRDTEMPYAAFVFMGQMVWLICSQGIMTTSGSLVAGGQILIKINFPKESLIFSSMGETIFDFLLRVPLLFIVFLATDFWPKPAIILVPILLLPLLLFITGAGFFLSLCNVMVRDVQNILGMVVNLGMFITPVIYPAPKTWPMSFLINTANPVSAYVTSARDLATVGYLTDPSGYLISVIISVTVFLAGWRIFHLVEPKIAERV